MKTKAKIVSGTAIAIIAVMTGIIFLVKGCLSQYDEYTQFGEAQGFKSANGNVIVILKEHYDVTSYSSGGGFTHISGYPYYYLETRDASNLKLLKSTQFEDKDDPVKRTPNIIGRDDELIWIFQGEIMAFNALTHEKVCTKEKMEQINADLKNNLPEDLQYYKYNYILNRLEITTKNALRFQVLKSLKAQRIDETESEETPEIAELKSIKQQLEDKRNQMSSNLNNKNMDAYHQLYDSISDLDDFISKKKDELRNNKEYNDKIQESRAKGFDYGYNLLGNGSIRDTILFALLSDKELKENPNNFYFGRIYGEDVQRKLYQASFKDIYVHSGFPSNCKVLGWKPVNNNISFLKGGFLENKDNLKIIELSNPQSWLILSAKEVGNKSKLILQRIDAKGTAVWTKELPIIDFSDMVYNGENLVLFSKDGEKITGSDKCNWIISVNLKTGDYVFLDLGNEEK